MEDTLSDIQSSKLDKKSYKNIFSALDDAIEVAKEERDLKLVDNPALRKALNIVEEFLRKSGRICYGGMAINAHLPTKTKFYDFSKTLPDYDFFTPNPDKDIKELVRLLKGAGFDDVSARVGMHEGTTKVFVNYIGVADITFIPQNLYSKLKKKAIHEDGITYADADFLRMNMYLELSRPQGEVERWEKVYKRLILLNMVKEDHNKKCKNKAVRINVVNNEMRNAMIDYVIKNNMIYVGADLKGIYEHYNKNPSKAILNSSSPVITFVENPELHFSILQQILQDIDPEAKLEIRNWPSYQEITPEMYGILLDGKIIALLIGEHYCYAYNTIKITNHRSIRIAALDTAITLFYQLTFVDGLDGIFPMSTLCFADTMVEISMKTRDKGVESQFPPFVTTCVGHQPSKASLLRKKIERIQLKKTQKKRSAVRSNQTLRRKNL